MYPIDWQGGSSPYLPYYNYYNGMNPNPIPSAPLLQDLEEMPICDVQFPKIVPFVQPRFQGQFNQIQERANQSYINEYSNLCQLSQLPLLNLNDSSICTLKQMEEKSKEGIISNLLTLMIKVLHVVGKLAIGIAVGTTIALVGSVLFGLPVAAALFSTIVALPLLGSLLVGNLVCKVAACGLSHLKQRWMEYSFRSAIQDEQERLLLSLKAWMQLKDLSKTEQRIQTTLQEMLLAQQYAGFDLQRQEKIVFLQEILGKIAHFQQIHVQLDANNSMPLLHQFLNK